MPSERFDLIPHENRWFPWTDVEECFWPGRGGRSHAINPSLASIRNAAGIYCVAWAPTGTIPIPDEQKVQYIGQTKNFKARMKICIISRHILGRPVRWAFGCLALAESKNRKNDDRVFSVIRT